MVYDFYSEIGHNLRAWIPAAPKISLKHDEQDQDESSEIVPPLWAGGG